MNKLNTWTEALMLMFVLLLPACGGGEDNVNTAPVASFIATPGSGVAPLIVGLNASASSDSDGQISSYSWNFGDGQTGGGLTTSHTFTHPGDYTIRLTAYYII